MCGRRQVTPNPQPKVYPMIGENGWMRLRYVGTEPPDIWYGEVTNSPYDYASHNTLLVDIRDAAMFLGPDFVEA